MKGTVVTKLLVSFVAVLSVLALAGCSSKNGSTSCGDWLGMNKGDQHTAVQNMISDRGGSSGELNYLTTLGSVKLFCAIHPSGDTLDKIYQG
jgi:hypothetical protein